MTQRCEPVHPTLHGAGEMTSSLMEPDLWRVSQAFFLQSFILSKHKPASSWDLSICPLPNSSHILPSSHCTSAEEQRRGLPRAQTRLQGWPP